MKSYDKYDFKVGQLASSGLIAINIVLLQGILSINPLDIPLTTAIIAISVSMPALVIEWFIMQFISHSSFKVSKMLFLCSNITGVIGGISAFIAIVATIWHILWIAGVIFISVSLVAFAIYGGVDSEMREYFKKEDENKATELPEN